MAVSNSHQWSLEEIEAWRQELQQPGVSLSTIAKRKGTSKQMVSKRVGPLNRKVPVGQSELDHMEQVIRLFKAGKSDEEMAAELELAVGTIKSLRSRLHIHRPNPTWKHTKQHSIWCAREWFKEHGYTPVALDWNPSAATAKGQPERAQRYQDFKQQFDCPEVKGIQRHFVSWSAFIRQTKLPRATKVGGGGYARSKKSQPSA